MDIISVMYTIIGVMLFMIVVVVLIVIAGKDILMAFKRRFVKRGCEVYMANTNRNISHYYLVPKEGMFKIDKLPYLTNPQKTMNLTEESKLRVADSILQTEKRLKAKIKQFELKKGELEAMIKDTKDEKQLYYLKSQIEHYVTAISTTEKLLRLKQENYFKDQRPAFFYIEGDPVPKDFYEWYSAMDNKIIDNLVTRSLSEPEESKKKIDEQLKFLKFWTMIAAGTAGGACILAFMAVNSLNTICANMGLTCGLV